MNDKKNNPKRYSKEFLLSLRHKGQIPKNYDQIEKVFKPTLPITTQCDQKDLVKIISSTTSIDEVVKLINQKIESNKTSMTDLKNAILKRVNEAEAKIIEGLKIAEQTNILFHKFYKTNSDLSHEIINNSLSQFSELNLSPNQNGNKIKEFLATNDEIKKNEIKIEDKKVNTLNHLKHLRDILKKLFENEDDSNDFILDGIKTEFSDEVLKSKDFIGTMSIVICKQSIENSVIFNVNLFVKRLQLLKSFINSNEKLSMECLSAIKCLNETSKCPSGFLNDAFCLLYDFGVVKKDVFFKWKEKYSEQKYEKLSIQLNEFFENLNL
ncbi:unnamed protein product [Brachionus calyciflorus]|uniref:W2 domain-containing protein n=1 Tax=Brachionus calyciflorus TaxID=104777 RepID=A0A814B8I2_9BILA|nr:unnamed protein product [Brachionus calyciflorus]